MSQQGRVNTHNKPAPLAKETPAQDNLINFF